MYSKRLSSIILALLLVPSLALASEDVNYGVVNALLLDVQDASHQALWDVFVDVAGREFINEHVNQFRIIDPENDEYLAYVQQDGWDVTKWAFAVDADQLEAVSEYEFLETIIHEYTHILTLNTQEFDLDIRLFEGNEQYDQQAQAACNSYFNGEGCAKSGSYMDTFYQSFWTDIIDAHTLINPEDYDQLADFAQEYPGQFITWYAPTNAEEDIAESFAHFVLDEPEDYTGIAQEKIEFFYEFPELNTIRERIRTHITIQEPSASQAEIDELTDRLAGFIMLLTDQHGEAWYIDPVSRLRYYLKDGPTAYEFLRTFGLGITNTDLATLPKETDEYGGGALAERLAGRIILQVEERGQAYYINPIDLKAYYLKDGDAAYQIMRELSLGTLKEWVDDIPTGASF